MGHAVFGREFTDCCRSNDALECVPRKTSLDLETTTTSQILPKQITLSTKLSARLAKETLRAAASLTANDILD